MSTAERAFDGLAVSESDAEGRHEDRLPGVVHGERFARQQDVDVAAAYEIAEVRAAAGVDDDRSGDEGDPLAGGLRLFHHHRDLGDADFDAALPGNLVRHEREAVSIARPELGDDLDALHAAP